MMPWREEIEQLGRFGLMLPWFVVALAFSWWRTQRHRLQLVGAVCASASVTMYFLTQATVLGTFQITATLISSLIFAASQYLVGVAVAVPLRTRALAVALLVSLAMFPVGAMAINPPIWSRRELRNMTVQQSTVVLGIVLVLIAVTWARERLLRISFAQREQLEAANAELARMNAEKNEFMAIAAHDLRGPLAAVGGTARQLQERSDPAAAQRDAAAIETQARRMLALVNDYLGAHAAESGALPVRRARIELAAAAREGAGRHAAAARAKGQTIAVDETPEPVWVEADAALLAQVVDNFLSNALKFSPAGATVRLEVHTAGGHPRARLAVVDQGPGIAAAEQARLFRKFGRGSAQPTGGEGSHGLGLAVAKRLAEAMEGAVGCESPSTSLRAGEPGAGATFWVELPRVSAENIPA
ncbi:MAG: HAMP domain-containing histidine kinase [Verrucomicrobia bacterium]|nr:HAMP domain-containing histidine kinase [Verrucomicrobiota bacterium]